VVLYPNVPQAFAAGEGPLDVTEVREAKPFIDFGSLRVISRPDIQIKAEVEETTGVVVAVTLVHKGSSVQLQAFAAPKSEGLWNEIRGQLKAGFAAQGAAAEERIGTFGPELIANVMQGGLGLKLGNHRIARFIGVDGPRWFLRGIITGPAATEPVSGFEIDEVFRGVVINRGDAPIPPRDLLPLSIPESSLYGTRDF
jgi:hypothetical protein